MVTVDDLAQEVIFFDQQCAHLNAEGEALRGCFGHTGQELENAANLFRFRNDDKPRFNENQAGNMIPPTFQG